jgi:hypothetical protein
VNSYEMWRIRKRIGEIRKPESRTVSMDPRNRAEASAEALKRLHRRPVASKCRVGVEHVNVIAGSSTRCNGAERAHKKKRPGLRRGVPLQTAVRVKLEAETERETVRARELVVQRVPRVAESRGLREVLALDRRLGERVDHRVRSVEVRAGCGHRRAARH